MSGRSRVLLAAVTFLLPAGVALAGAAPAGTPVRFRAEPTEALLPPVDPAWRVRGWRAVVPHAFVLRKLLPIRQGPSPSAPAVFWLKGGTRVPVLVQGKQWWKICWTDGRTGWAPAADLEPHASFVLIDAKSGKVLRRIAAKGQLGAVSDGNSLWSIANTGITRTLLGDRPVFWSRQVAGNRDANFPEWSVWNADRSAFIVRSRNGDEGTLLHTVVSTGAVKDLGSPSPGSLQGVIPNGRVLITRETGASEQTQLYDPGSKRIIRQVAGTAQAVTRSGISFLYQDTQLIRYGTDLHAQARSRVSGQIVNLCLTGNERYIAATYVDSKSEKSRVGIFHADTLKRVTTLTMGEPDGGIYLHHLGTWSGGWWIASRDDGGVLLARFRRNGKLLDSHQGYGEITVSPDGRSGYVANDEEISAWDTETGKTRSFPLSWRRKLPTQFLPAPSNAGTHLRLEVSSLTISPDGKVLLLTEWLSGDPEA